MRKIQLLGLAVCAVFAFSAVVTASAFAESEFLLNEKSITENTEANLEGELTFATKKVPLLGPLEILCTLVVMGTVLGVFPSHFLFESILDLEGHVVGLLGGTNETNLSCTNIRNCPTPLVWPDNLPWLAQIELMTAGIFLLDLTEDEEEPKGLPGYHIECMGSISLINLCTSLIGFKLTNGATDVVSSVTVAEQEAEGEVATCEVGEGFFETDPGTLISSPAGNLSVS